MLESHIKCVATFHDPVLLYNNTLTSSLNDTIISCIPITSCQFFFQHLQEFTEWEPQNGLAPGIFNFISKDLSKETKTFNNYPMGNEEVIPAVRVEIRPVRAQQNGFNSVTSRNSFQCKPCISCSSKGFDDWHYLLGKYCGITKLSSKEILQVMKRVNACFTCGFQHSSNSATPPSQMESLKLLLHDRVPVNLAICKHNDDLPSVTISKVGSNKTIPIMAILSLDYQVHPAGRPI